MEEDCKDCKNIKVKRLCKNCISINQAGIFILSYLCEIGTIINYCDIIDDGIIHGLLNTDFFGLKKGTYIYLKIKNEPTKNSFILKYMDKKDMIKIYNDVGDNICDGVCNDICKKKCIPWFEHDDKYGVYTKHIKININYETILD